MDPKNIARLAFLLVVVITMCIAAEHICQYYAFGVVDSPHEWYTPFQYMKPIPKKVLFHLAIKEHGLFFYLIPVIWFLVSIYAVSKEHCSRLLHSLLYFSGLANILGFIFIIVDAAYLPHYVWQILWIRNRILPHKECDSLHCLFWDYIEKFFS